MKTKEKLKIESGHRINEAYLSVSLSVHGTNCLSVCLSVVLFCLPSCSVFLSVRISVYLCLCACLPLSLNLVLSLSVCASICLSVFCLSRCSLSISLRVFVDVFAFLGLSVHLYFYVLCLSRCSLCPCLLCLCSSASECRAICSYLPRPVSVVSQFVCFFVPLYVCLGVLSLFRSAFSFHFLFVWLSVSLCLGALCSLSSCLSLFVAFPVSRWFSLFVFFCLYVCPFLCCSVVLFVSFSSYFLCSVGFPVFPSRCSFVSLSVRVGCHWSPSIFLICWNKSSEGSSPRRSCAGGGGAPNPLTPEIKCFSFFLFKLFNKFSS